MARVYGIRPWDVGRLTLREHARLTRDYDEGVKAGGGTE